MKNANKKPIAPPKNVLTYEQFFESYKRDSRRELEFHNLFDEMVKCSAKDFYDFNIVFSNIIKQIENCRLYIDRNYQESVHNHYNYIKKRLMCNYGLNNKEVTTTMKEILMSALHRDKNFRYGINKSPIAIYREVASDEFYVKSDEIKSSLFDANSKIKGLLFNVQKVACMYVLLSKYTYLRYLIIDKKCQTRFIVEQAKALKIDETIYRSMHDFFESNNNTELPTYNDRYKRTVKRMTNIGFRQDGLDTHKLSDTVNDKEIMTKHINLCINMLACTCTNILNNFEEVCSEK